MISPGAPSRRRPGAGRSRAASPSRETRTTTTGTKIATSTASATSGVRDAPCIASIVVSAHRRRDRQVHAVRGPDPHPLDQPPSRSPRRSAAASQPGHDAAGGSRRPDAHLPHGSDRPGGLGRSGGGDPRRGARRLPAVAPHAAVPGAAPGGGARYAGAHLLQVRGRVAGRVAQGEQRGAPGLRQQGGRHRAPVHGDRRRPVGLGPRHGLQHVRAGVPGLHGGCELRPEALPASHDGELGLRG